MLDLVLWFSLLGIMPLAVAIASRLISGVAGLVRRAAPSESIALHRRPVCPAKVLRPNRVPDRVKSLRNLGKKCPRSLFNNAGFEKEEANMSDPQPSQQLMQMTMGSWISRAIYVSAKLRIADHLANGPRSEGARHRGRHDAWAAIPGPPRPRERRRFRPGGRWSISHEPAGRAAPGRRAGFLVGLCGHAWRGTRSLLGRSVPGAGGRRRLGPLQRPGGQLLPETAPGGADAYMLGHIIHRLERREGRPHSRQASPRCRPGELLLVEYVVPDGGDGALFAKWLVLHMMVAADGRERTEAEYRRLFANHGFRLTRVVPTATDISVVEGVPA